VIIEDALERQIKPKGSIKREELIFSRSTTWANINVFGIKNGTAFRFFKYDKRTSEFGTLPFPAAFTLHAAH
jgi:hypothetical protein